MNGDPNEWGRHLSVLNAGGSEPNEGRRVEVSAVRSDLSAGNGLRGANEAIVLIAGTAFAGRGVTAVKDLNGLNDAQVLRNLTDSRATEELMDLADLTVRHGSRMALAGRVRDFRRGPMACPAGRTARR